MRLYLILLSIIALSNTLIAQNFSTKYSSYGICGGYNLNFHHADFKEFSGYPNCCDKFTNGYGNGIVGGLYYRFPIINNLTSSLRAGIFGFSGTLERNEQTVVSGAIPATIRHTLVTSLPMLGIEPIVQYNAFGPFNFIGGFRASTPISARFSQFETLIQPNTGTFENGRRIRNEATDNIPQANALGFAIIAGMSADFPLSTMKQDNYGRFSGGCYISPEILYSIALNQSHVTNNLDWSINTLRIGVSIGYIPGDAISIESIQDDTEKKSSIVTLPIPPPPLPLPPTAHIIAKGVENDGAETPAVKIHVEEFLSTNVKPLLNYIFFDENSSELPLRYNQINTDATNKFSINSHFNASTLDTYHNILNIIGKRLRDNPSAKITLIGCNSENASEKNNLSLSRHRAETVRDYLASVWKIAPERMIIQSRNLPENPSNLNNPDGIPENRRVEIISDVQSILEPVFAQEIYREISPPKLRFYPQAQGERSIIAWEISAGKNINSSEKFEGVGSPPRYVEWELQRTPDAVVGAAALNYHLSVTDSMNLTATADSTIPVEQITIQKKRSTRVKDKIIDRYSLILFDFDKSEISGMNSYIMDYIRKQLTSDASISIIGYTDRIGDADHNRRLSTERAIAAAKQLNTKNYDGKGEDVELYDNSLPEGRFYSRTVEIVVERPAE